MAGGGVIRFGGPHTCDVRQGKISKELQCRLGQAVTGNHVARKLLSLFRRHRLARCILGIKDIHTCSRCQSAQVTGALGRCGNPQQDRTGIFGARALIIRKKEGLILDNGPPKGSSELAPQTLRQEPATGIYGNRLGERISRLGQVIAPEHEGAAMILVAAGFGRG